jgi:voltage-gated potassium channel
LERNFLYFVPFSAIAVILGATSVYYIESSHSGEETKIKTLGDAFWWAMITVTAVGYGDFYPVTTGGRIIALILMIVGNTILGALISTIAATLIELKSKKINLLNWHM